MWHLQFASVCLKSQRSSNDLPGVHLRVLRLQLLPAHVGHPAPRGRPGPTFIQKCERLEAFEWTVCCLLVINWITTVNFYVLLQFYLRPLHFAETKQTSIFYVKLRSFCPIYYYLQQNYKTISHNIIFLWQRVDGGYHYNQCSGIAVDGVMMWWCDDDDNCLQSYNHIDAMQTDNKRYMV